ncbi:hypothetical protein BDZ45DRAFT_709122 [Acephala macrosclerotiorum]|nr:hypothetical protein BDZ45DRAFT_709122 [Acephala macrosclerotiorum]
MTTASTPATPGPSTPTTVRTLPLDQLKYDDDFENFVPPTRPKSTPFPCQDLTSDGGIQPLPRSSDLDQPDHTSSPIPEPEPTASTETSSLSSLPIEIHECILDHLFGVRSSAASRTTSSAGKSKVLRGWGTALRHSRRREVSELALVSEQWRELVQERLYRHLKIKGTTDSVAASAKWFELHPHLCSYVKHIEIWFPVFQQKNPAFDRTLRIPSTTPDRSSLIRSLSNQMQDTATPITYQAPSNNCTLQEVFMFVGFTFLEACILTLEGGERKKPPMVHHFLNPEHQRLPVIKSVRTLVCKGQWNLIRSIEDFQNIATALPNLNEWHGSYAKPKSKSYISMATILPKLPRHLTHLNICLEADYRREIVCPEFFKKVGNHTHFCVEMAKAIPTLEHLAYTGRVCHAFFDDAAKLSSARDSRLKSIDLIVKNCCRPTFLWNNGSGITDMAFIMAFETLVISGVKALERLAALEFLRIRFIDLESQVPSLNPYFQLAKNQCTGLWSEMIIDALSRARPAATFIEKPENLDDVGIKDGQLLTSPSFSKTRPLTIKVSSYINLSGGITIT